MWGRRIKAVRNEILRGTLSGFPSTVRKMQATESTTTVQKRRDSEVRGKLQGQAVISFGGEQTRSNAHKDLRPRDENII